MTGPFVTSCSGIDGLVHGKTVCCIYAQTHVTNNQCITEGKTSVAPQDI